MSDNVDFDGNVSYTKEPDKYNKKDWWYQFQVHCALKAYKYPPFATNYKKNWKPREEGYSIRQKKRDAELFKKYGTKVIQQNRLFELTNICFLITFIT